MLYIGQHELLMLLFMMATKRNDGRKLCQPPLVKMFEQVEDAVIYVSAVLIDLPNGRASNEAAPGAHVPFSEGVVVRVEEVGILRMWRLVAWKSGGKKERLEKPADMGQMPFGWANIWHGLNHIVFGDERLAQGFGEAAHVLIAFYKICPGSRWGLWLNEFCHDECSPCPGAEIGSPLREIGSYARSSYRDSWLYRCSSVLNHFATCMKDAQICAWQVAYFNWSGEFAFRNGECGVLRFLYVYIAFCEVIILKMLMESYRCVRGDEYILGRCSVGV